MFSIKAEKNNFAQLRFPELFDVTIHENFICCSSGVYVIQGQLVHLEKLQ